MSAQIETVFDQLSIVGNQKNSQARGSNSPSDGTVFADLLRDQAATNVTFLNPGSQLSIPEGAQTEEFDTNNQTSHIDNDTAAEADEAVDDGQYAEDDQSDQEEVATSDKQDANDDAAPTVTGMVAAAIDPNAAAKTDGTNAQVSQGPNQAAQATSADKSGAQNAQQTGQQQAQSTDASQMNLTKAETVDIDPAQLQQKQSNTNASGLNVTVTEKQTVVTGQQNSTLAASSTVAAQTAKTAEAGGEKTTIADMLLEGAEEAALMGRPTGDKAKTAQSETQANSGNGNMAGQNLPNPQTQLADTPVAPNATPQNAIPTTAPVANAGNAASAGAPSAAAGSVGQVASVDSATGTPVLEGQNGQTTKTSASTQAAANNNRPNIPPQLVSDQVSVNIQRAVGQGQDQIKIQLRPYELGRIEVTMEMAKDGKMTAVVTAEKQETLDMLKGDSNTLLKSLNDAGLQADSSSLSFNLGNQGNGYNQFADGNGGNNGPDSKFSLEGEDGTEDEAEANTMLGLGEEAQPDADGRYDIQV